MAKTTVGQWDTTAANNTDIGGIGIQGTNLVSNFDNAEREMMAQIATFKTAAYFGSATDQKALVGGGTITPAVQIRGTTNNNSGLLLATFSATASTGPRLDFYRSKDAALDTATVVASGDRLGTIAFFGAQQTGTLANQVAGVSIRAEVDGVVTSGAGGDMPGRLIIATTPDGSGAATDRLTIDSSGKATFTTTIVLKTGTAPTPTTEGGMEWDSDDDVLVVGDGAAQKVIGDTKITAEVASTSGTSIDFTGIPSWAKRITIMFVGVSTNGTSDIIVQTGDSGGIETSGYLGTGSTIAAAAVATAAFTAGFGVARSPEAAGLLHGSITLSMQDASDFTWVESGVLGQSSGASATTYTSGGSKATSAALDRVRITTAGGANTFDAGVISVQYSS